MNKPLYAIWRYSFQSYTGIDGFTGGPVNDMNDTGKVQTSNYGKGHWFMPVRLLPLKEGEKLMAKLEALRKEYAAAHKAVDVEFTKR